MHRVSGFLLLYHAVFAAAGAGLLLWLSPPLLGTAIGAWALLYVALLGILSWMRGRSDLLDLWSFLLLLSLCQVLPDVLLVNQLGVLTFPNLGGERWHSVPLFMAGLWVAPLLLVLWVTDAVHQRSSALALVVCAVASLCIFGAAEWAARPFGIWQARGVHQWHGVALYVLPAEVILGLASWLVYSAVQGRSLLHKACGAVGVSLCYSGALLSSLYLVERLLLN